MKRKIKILLTKVGLDAHTKGLRLLAETLQNAGMEVVQIGHYKWPKEIADAAIEKNVDMIGISTLVANYDLIYELFGILREKGFEKPVLVGGTIAAKHVEKLKEAGVDEVFLPGTDTDSIIDYIKTRVDIS